MINKIRYIGRYENQDIGYENKSIEEALQLGMNYSNNGADMKVTETEKLKFLMHRHSKYLKIKFNYEHKYTIAELYELCPAVLLDMYELYGGIEYIAETLIGYDQLYNEEQIKSRWEGKLQ